ncbi:MAG: AAA family ATPase [Dissulfurispiraceae bacterium]|jgi:general secretion pathway protein A|nr:AAA family ATPase [Dissulfurispiraceae bacterium]
MTAMQYLAFFNLKEDPFRLTPDPFFYYPSQEHDEILQSLNYTIEQKEGFFLAMGEPGTGKTTTLKVFIEAWKDRADIALIMTPRLSPEEFLLAVLEDLGIHHSASGKNEMLKTFRDFLLRSSQQGRRVIIIVDEAQNLPPETIEELRLLSNLETEKEKLLQIVLVGQPELESKIMSDEMRQLRQRITVRTNLKPLTFDETVDYINYRLAKAGRGNAVFEDASKKRIHKITSGVPRLINMYASRAMMAAYLEGSRSIEKKHVKHAEKHFGHTHASAVRFRFVWIVMLAFAAAVISAGSYKFYSAYNEAKNTATVTAHEESNVHQDTIAAENTAEGDHLSTGSAVRSEHQSPQTTPRLIVNVKSATLRSEPSMDSKAVAWASEGIFFDQIETAEDLQLRKWYKVKLADGGTAWIAASIVNQAE